MYQFDDYTIFFFFNDTATTEIYTLSLHDALPIWVSAPLDSSSLPTQRRRSPGGKAHEFATSVHLNPRDRKSTRLNSSHANISYAVFCLKKKKRSYNTTKHVARTK